MNPVPLLAPTLPAQRVARALAGLVFALGALALLGSALERLAGIDAAAIAGGQRIAYTKSVAEALDPSGKKMVFDTILTIKDKNRHSYEMWTKGKNGKKFRTMLIEYTRA
jgi:hypothetical protein